jgi:hypothetical protein
LEYLVYETALHEACHAVAAHALSLPVEEIGIAPGKRLHTQTNKWNEKPILGYMKYGENEYSAETARKRGIWRDLRMKYATVSGAGIWFETTHSNMPPDEIDAVLTGDRDNITSLGFREESYFVRDAGNLLKERLPYIELLAADLMRKRVINQHKLEIFWREAPHRLAELSTPASIRFLL